MKRKYVIPSQTTDLLCIRHDLLQTSPGSGVYTDDPQHPGDALVKDRHETWEDETWKSETNDLWADNDF